MVGVIFAMIGKHYIEELVIPEVVEKIISEEEMKFILEKELGGKDGVEDTILEMKKKNASVIINGVIYKKRGDKFLEIKKV